jgi:DNA polymerase-1
LWVQGHALRAAINTPIQGSAADVATAAMLSIDACQELKELSWKMLLQVLLFSLILSSR